MDYVDVHDFCSVSALVIGAPGKRVDTAPKASGCFFGRDTRNLRRCFRGFVGGNRKSRRREAAGRRNYPEAVPHGEGRNGSYAPQQVLLVHLRKTEVHKEAANAAVGREEGFESRSEVGEIPSATKRTQEGDL